MWEVSIVCIAAALTCAVHAIAPQPPFARYHYTKAQCIAELDRMILSFDQGNAAYRFRCIEHRK